MGFVKNTTASLGEGFKTDNGTLAWLEVLSCTIAGIVVFAFFFSPYRRWHANPVLKLLLWAAAGPTWTIMSYTLGIMESTDYSNELYLVWAVFLSIAYGSLTTTSDYSLYTSSKERMTFEAAEFTNNIYVALFIASFREESKFKRPLWALWCLTMAKMIQRILSFRRASRRYRTENTKLVADYMNYEHELTNHDEVDPAADMKGYKYLVVGEDNVKIKARAPDYLPRLDITDNKVITIDKVWQCDGRLLRSDGNLGRRLKDVCLSFALFKLLRRRFANHSAAEAAHAKTHDFVFRGLLMTDNDHRRAFRVIKVELEFLYDLFYTKYPISFSSRVFLIFYILQISVIMLSMWTTIWVLHDYETPQSSRVVDGVPVDVIITYVFVVLIMIMEVWEFCNYLLSDWAKVMLTCDYVENSTRRDLFCLDWVYGIICRGKIWRPLDDKIGQYCLLENFRYTSLSIRYHVTCGLTVDKKGKGVRKQAAVKLPREVKEAIFLSLRRSEGQLSNGEFSLRRNGVSAKLSWACRLPSHAHTIMVWHIATSHFEIKSPEKSHRKDTEPHRLVATRLSRYCAYLLVFAPELLPVSSFAIKYMLEEIVSETRTFFKGCKSKGRMCEEVMKTGDPAETIIKLGARLAQQLASVVEDEGQRWRILAEFWAELILFLAPSDDVEAHAEKLVTGGEFITHLWALLYHAGILKQPSPPPPPPQDDTVTAFSV